MSITWFAPEPVRLRLTPADGGAQVSLAAGAVGSHSVGLPAGGRWRITLEHGQRALVAVDLVPVAATVVVVVPIVPDPPRFRVHKASA